MIPLATLIAPGGAVCEVEGDELIAALKADGFEVAGEKKPARKQSVSKSEK